MTVLSLSGDGWTVASEEGGPHPAVVPGCVHDALIDAGVIPDPDRPGGEAAQSFVGRTDWTWRRTFIVDPALLERAHVELVFESIDTVGTVLLNGTVLGEVASQFVPHRFDARSALRPGSNELEVRLRGTLAEAERLERIHGERPVNADGAWGPFSQLRKSACNFGWDWGPCCPTCGLGGDVRIEGWDGSRIEAVRPHVEFLDPERARLRVAVDVAGPARSATITVRDEGGEVIARSEGGLDQTLAIERPPIWWPRGLGAPRLVTIEVELEDGDRVSRRTGLRQVELEDGPDGRFAVRVNGEPVFCRGANWIPSRLFPHGQTLDDVEPLLQSACEAEMNMLRVWGGGLYEPGFFYERCDELGLMVWQDFMFACATYPEHAEMRGLVAAEARAQVRRLAHHPSIVLWCGGNEDVLAWYGWGWRERMAPDDAWGLHFWTDLLPTICAELDPSRPYWTESPWSGSVEHDPNDPEIGDRHTWDLRLEACRELVPRFASEFGHQSPPDLLSLTEALGREANGLEPAELSERQRAWGGDAVQYAPHLEAWFGISDEHPVDFERWHWAAQLLQARAMSMACTWLRANRPRCEGALIWQLNDIWTGHSWSLVDVARRPKPAFHAVRNAFDPVLVAIEPVSGSPCVVLLNDSASPVGDTLLLRRVALDGRVLEVREEAVVLEARRGRRVLELTDGFRSHEDGCLVADWAGRRAVAFAARDRALAYREAELDARLEPTTPGAARLVVTASTLVRDLVVRASLLGPAVRADRGCLTLLPGESVKIGLVGLSEGTPAILPPGLLRTANDLRFRGT